MEIGDKIVCVDFKDITVSNCPSDFFLGGVYTLKKFGFTENLIILEELPNNLIFRKTRFITLDKHRYNAITKIKERMHGNR